jgi:isopenicillin N synthase-like dioxygenase
MSKVQDIKRTIMTTIVDCEIENEQWGVHSAVPTTKDARQLTRELFAALEPFFALTEEEKAEI